MLLSWAGLAPQQWPFYTSNSCGNAREIPSRSHDLQMLIERPKHRPWGRRCSWKSPGRAASASLGFASLPFRGEASELRDSKVSFDFGEWGNGRGLGWTGGRVPLFLPRAVKAEVLAVSYVLSFLIKKAAWWRCCCSLLLSL